VGDIDALRQNLRQLGRVVVAFSGGADSSLLAFVANEVLGPQGALVVTAVSASLARSELADCRALAREWGLNYREVESQEAARPGYVANGRDRCWYCKDELMRCLGPVAAPFGRSGAGQEGARSSGSRGAYIALGVNIDDLSDHRPGQVAARDGGAIFPLVDAGFTKADVRETSRSLGLRTWDKPAAACLASRLPYGTPVSLGILGAVERAEAGLAALGFRESRVRHYGELARIELPLADIARAVAGREQLVRAVQAAGYRYVTLDMEGLRSGNLNGASPPNEPGRADQEMAI
jgi:uncharacterized protein